MLLRGPRGAAQPWPRAGLAALRATDAAGAARVAALWHDALLLRGDASAGPLALGAAPHALQARVAAQLLRRERRRRAAAPLHKAAVAELWELQLRAQHAQREVGGAAAPAAALNRLLRQWRAAAAARRAARRAQALRRARLARTLLLVPREGEGSGEGRGGGGGVAGYVSLSVSQPRALLPPPFPSAAPACLYLDALAVAPRWRRRGAGAALLRAACAAGRRCGARALWLRARIGNYPALALYRSEGFRTVAVVGPPWRRENLMRKDLGAAGGRAPAAVRAGGAAAAAGGGAPAAARAGGAVAADGAAAARAEGAAAGAAGEAAAAEGGAAAGGAAAQQRVYVWDAQEGRD
ncbi:MAG: acyl-CoA N-acyltransferase [Monoraphidium minutum]|nr:MAG: acyl-CoA N-acyltransferase [Monoraphidium minutum]